MNAALLAAVLDGSIVVLDPQHARVVLLSPQMERIWRACTGRRTEEIAAVSGEAHAAVMSSLPELAEAGLVHAENGMWSQTAVTWV